MKKAISFFAAVTLLVLVSCSSGGGGGDSLVDDINVSDANVQPARSVALSELPTTGRTTNITTDTALRTVLQGLQDSELLAGLAGGEEGGSTPMLRASNYASYDAFMDGVMDAFESFPQTRSINESYSGTDVEADGFVVNSVAVSIRGGVDTTDGNALSDAESEFFPSNFKRGAFAVSASIDAESDPAEIPTDSAIKACSISANFAASASCGSAVYEGVRMPSDIAYSYAANASVGITYNDGVYAGRIVIAMSVDTPLEYLDDMSEMDEENPTASFEPDTMSVTVTVYNDAGTSVFTRSYNTLDAFMDAFGIELFDDAEEIE
jgi:hypothetical protein